jgi:diaminopimelate decarboxylase
MNYFHYKNNELFAEQVPITQIASEVGTPCYIYSRAAIEDAWHAFDKAFGNTPHRICYAVKANSNIGILNLLAQLNSGFDIVSIGELERVLAAGGDPQKIVFSGVGKQIAEIKRALQIGIYCFNVESEAELERLNSIAKDLNKTANISLRVNPNIDARTHPYIATGLNENKFGIDLNLVLPLARKIKSLTHLNLISIGCHIGSQLTELDPFVEALDCLLNLVTQLSAEGFSLRNINIGGGLGICYRHETPPAIQDYVETLIKKISPHQLEIIIEPGRIIVGNAGILVTRVEYLKHTEHKNFAIVDAAMNDLMRPALYQAWHNIQPVIPNTETPVKTYDLVGPVCESADFIAKDRPLAIQTDDLLAITTTGAYGFSMSSNYNSRPRPPEVLIDGSDIHCIRTRETISDLFAHEHII